MDEKQYMETRVDDQINYYDTQSKNGRNWYKGLSLCQILCGATIPFVSGFSSQICYSEWVTGFLGLLVTVSTGLLSLNKYQERWINFRTTCETLKHLKNLFLTRSTPYKGDKAFDNFVNDIEVVISKENSEWCTYVRKQSENT